MKKINLIGIFAIILIAIIPIALSEIDVTNKGVLNDNSKIFLRQTYLKFDNEETIDRGLPTTIEFGCEGIDAFNSKNPDYNVKNVSLRIGYWKKEFNLSTLKTTLQYSEIFYGCSPNSPTCDGSNTPMAIGESSEFWSFYLCKYFGLFCTYTSSIKEITYSLENREMLLVEQMTYFNDTSKVITDSPCSYGLSLYSENCRGCKAQSYEETIRAIENRQSTFETKTTIFDYVSNVVDFNFYIWTAISYIVKIGVLVAVIVGVIFVLFWFLNWLKGLK